MCLLAVAVVGAVLDGSKVYRQSHTRLKRSPKAHLLELPTNFVNKVKASAREQDLHIPVESVLARSRSRRDGKDCGFDTSTELEINPVSQNYRNYNISDSYPSPLSCMSIDRVAVFCTIYRWILKRVLKLSKLFGLAKM